MLTAVHTDREHALTGAFVTLADTLVTGYDVVELLYDLAELSTELVAADAATILLADDHGDPQVIAYTCEQVQTLALHELSVGHGPGLDCYHPGAPLSIADLTATAPVASWPGFAEHATQQGFRAATPSRCGCAPSSSAP